MPDAADAIPAWGALLNDKQLAAYVSLSRAMVWRMVSNGDLPKPIKLPGRVTRWRREDVDRAIRKWAKE